MHDGDVGAIQHVDAVVACAQTELVVLAAEPVAGVPTAEAIEDRAARAEAPARDRAHGDRLSCTDDPPAGIEVAKGPTRRPATGMGQVVTAIEPTTGAKRCVREEQFAVGEVARPQERAIVEGLQPTPQAREAAERYLGVGIQEANMTERTPLRTEIAAGGEAEIGGRLDVIHPQGQAITELPDDGRIAGVVDDGDLQFGHRLGLSQE